MSDELVADLEALEGVAKAEVTSSGVYITPAEGDELPAGVVGTLFAHGLRPEGVKRPARLDPVKVAVVGR